MEDEDAYVGLEEPTEPPGEGGDEEPGGVVINRDRELPQAPPESPEDASRRGAWLDILMAFLGFRESLNLHPRIEDVRVHVEPPISMMTEQLMQKGLPHPIHSDLLAMYRAGNGFEMSWSWRGDDGELEPVGQLCVHGFERMSGSWLGDLWGEWEGWSEEDLELLWETRGFAGVEDAATGWAVVLHVERDVLMLHHREHGMYEMDIAPEDYLGWAMAARGISGWEFLRSDYDFGADPLGLERGRVFFETAARVFPDLDVSVFRDRVALRD